MCYSVSIKGHTKENKLLGKVYTKLLCATVLCTVNKVVAKDVNFGKTAIATLLAKVVYKKTNKILKMGTGGEQWRWAMGGIVYHVTKGRFVCSIFATCGYMP